VVRVEESAAVLLALAEQASSANELLIEHDHHLVVGATDHCATEAERNVVSHCRVHVHNAVAHFVVARGALAEWRAPVRESFSEDHVGFKALHWFHLQRNILVVVLNCRTVIIQTGNDSVVEGIEAHLHIWQLADRQCLNPVKNFLNLAHSLWVLITVQRFELIDCRAFVANLLDCLEHLWVFFLVLFENLHALK
jgi:hypothetical protein